MVKTIRHCILVKWNARVSDQNALLPAIEALFRETLAIPGVEKVDLIPNVIDRPNRFDLMIVITMQESALPAYDVSEPHKAWKEQYGSLIEAKAIFDADSASFSV